MNVYSIYVRITTVDTVLKQRFTLKQIPSQKFYSKSHVSHPSIQICPLISHLFACEWTRAILKFFPHLMILPPFFPNYACCTFFKISCLMSFFICFNLLSVPTCTAECYRVLPVGTLPKCGKAASAAARMGSYLSRQLSRRSSCSREVKPTSPLASTIT